MEVFGALESSHEIATSGLPAFRETPHGDFGTWADTASPVSMPKGAR